MPSRSSANNWLLSFALHLAFFGAIAITLYRPAVRRSELDLKVIEAPKAVPQTPPDISRAKPKPAKPKKAPRAVYGVSRNAMTAKEGGEEVKLGNTVAKAPDAEKLKPEDADALPIPTDEYLVSEMPALLSEIRIPYPPEAKEKGIEGAVMMEILIDGSGAVREAVLVQGPGAGLDEAALVAVRGFKFKPARMQEKAVAVRIRYAYRFVLER